MNAHDLRLIVSDERVYTPPQEWKRETECQSYLEEIEEMYDESQTEVW